MVKIGLIGLGYLGKIHLKLLNQITGFELVGIYDIDKSLTAALAEEYSIKPFHSCEDLIAACDAIDIVTPSNTHFQIASDCLKNNKHVFIEKPATSTVEEAISIKDLSKSSGTVVQIGHVERFNPAFIAAKSFVNIPQYIDFKRLAIYNPRGTDVSVTLDLMIHDLDLLLTMVKSNIKSISANGVIVISHSADIVNARIEFENGCVANITADRTSSSNMRKITVYQSDTLINIDLLEKTTGISRFKNASADTKNQVIIPGKGIPNKEVIVEYPNILQTNAIKEELIAFNKSINTATKPVVTIEDAIDVLSLAFSIDEKILNLISK